MIYSNRKSKVKKADISDCEPLITGWLLTHYGFSSVGQWIESIVKYMLDSTKQEFPPIKLEPLFKIRKILDFSKNYYVNSWEQRFISAHEIAHTFFFDISTSPPKKTFSDIPPQILEILCNRIAEEILMPIRMVNEYLNKHYPLIENRFKIEMFKEIVFGLVKLFNVSPYIAIRRLIGDMNLWNIVVLGVGWRAKSTRKEVRKIGILEPKESGFVFRTNITRDIELESNQNYNWRLEWNVKPPWAQKEIFIPYFGNPEICLKIVEDLYKSYIKFNYLEKKEPLVNFKLGNLGKYLKKIYGIRKSYNVFAFFSRKPLEEGKLFPGEIDNEENDLYKRLNTKIIVCIPLGRFRKITQIK